MFTDCSEINSTCTSTQQTCTCKIQISRETAEYCCSSRVIILAHFTICFPSEAWATEGAWWRINCWSLIKHILSQPQPAHSSPPRQRAPLSHHGHKPLPSVSINLELKGPGLWPEKPSWFALKTTDAVAKSESHNLGMIRVIIGPWLCIEVQ